MLTKEEKMEKGLKELMELNDLRNDFDAYKYELIRWALGYREDKPKLEDYGF